MPALGFLPLRIPGKATPGDQLCLVPQLDQLSPRPERVILAVAKTQALEGTRVLPEIRLMEELSVMGVLAPQQPVLQLVERADARQALSLEVPGEVVA